MYYDKRIRYLSYYESGIKLQNAGYVKFQVRDSLCQMAVNVKGPRLMGSGEAKVYLLSERNGRKDEGGFYSENRNNLNRHLLGTLSIRNGQGFCNVRLRAENMADSGMWYDEICGIRIELHEYQYLESQWHVINFMPGKKERQSEDAGKNQIESRKPYQQDEPVEVSLIVTPVSENLRVEKAGAREFMPDFEEIEDFMADQSGEGGFLGKENTAGISGRKENVEEDPKRAENEEESMQEILEREILREEAAQTLRPEQLGETLEEEILRGMQEAEETDSAERPGITEQTGAAERTDTIVQLDTENRPEGQNDAEIMEDIRRSGQDLQPDKWEQLKRTYPIVHPIREEEEYLRITPKDFVIFTEKYQELVHNSFLLHGYYNYKHLIFGRKEKEGKTVYYLGVPGTFHEREKTVAVMFGFEAFDGKREPAENGDFGYYLRRVEI